MGIWIILSLVIALILILGGALCWFRFLDTKIARGEKKIIHIFSSRNDMLCPLYEILKDEVGRHEEIFREVGELRKKEFSLLSISHNIEGYMKLQSEIHHEVNFIFQIANKNPKLQKNKKFLYIREQILLQSAQMKKIIDSYNRAIIFYNQYIWIKNMTGIGLLLPFHKKQGI